MNTLSDLAIVAGDRKQTLETYQCPVCHDLITDLRECTRCRNAFCRVCVDKWQMT